MFVLESAYVRHTCYFNNVHSLNITHTDEINVKRESTVVSMKTLLNGLEQLDKGESAKTIADNFGMGEITEKKQTNHEKKSKNMREVNIQLL